MLVYRSVLQIPKPFSSQTNSAPWLDPPSNNCTAFPWLPVGRTNSKVWTSSVQEMHFIWALYIYIKKWILKLVVSAILGTIALRVNVALTLRELKLRDFKRVSGHISSECMEQTCCGIVFGTARVSHKLLLPGTSPKRAQNRYHWDLDCGACAGRKHSKGHFSITAA